MTMTPDPETTRKILKERARKLAEEPAKEETEFLQVLEFQLAYERYGIELNYIREVYPLKELTPLPGVPSFVIGILSVRGEILSVVDLKRFFELPETGLTDLNKVVVLRNEEMEFGILADAIVGIRTVPKKEVLPSLPTLSGIRQAYLKGVTRERLVILDGIKLLSDKKMIVHEEVNA